MALEHARGCKERCRRPGQLGLSEKATLAIMQLEKKPRRTTGRGTARKRGGQERMEEMEMLARFPVENPSPTLRVEKDGTIVYANAVAAPLLKSWGVKRGGRLPGPCRAEIAAALATGKPHGCEMTVKRQTYECVLVPLRDTNCVHIYAHDITAQREIEDALRASEELNRGTLQALPAHVAVLDWEGRIVAVNQAWSDFARRNGAEASDAVSVGANYLDVCRRAAVTEEAEAVKALRGIEQVLAGKERQFTMEYPCNGRRQHRWFMMSVTRFAYRGRQGAVVTHMNISERKEAEERLRQTNEELEGRVVERTAQLRALAGELTQTEEQERRRIAKILHDELQQLLVAARMHLGAMQTHRNPKLREESLAQAEQLLKESIGMARNLSHDLSLVVLEEEGLGPALQWLVKWMEQHHGLAVRLDAGTPVEGLAADMTAALFQSVRELLLNVVKHSGVLAADVRLQVLPAGEVELSVRDKGRGFDPAKAEREVRDRFGLFSIRERLQLLGGRMEVESAAGQGAMVRLRAPLHSEEQPGPAKGRGGRRGKAW